LRACISTASATRASRSTTGLCASDADLHRVGAIECSARFLGASGGNTDAGFADRDLFWARAIEDALVVRFRRLQARFKDVNVLGEGPYGFYR
jgi:hypothetical protein